MAYTWSGIVRTIGLYVLIITSLAAAVLLALIHQVWWWALIAALYCLVGCFEVASYVQGGKTISTRYKDSLKQGGKHALIARVALICLWAAFTGLIVHLWFF